MENNEILQKLLARLEMIHGIRSDDGYVIYRVADIGRGAIELLKQLNVDDDEDKTLINETVEEHTRVNAIEQRYYNDEQYKKWIRKEARSGNVQIFMQAINCIEGALEVFLHKVGLYK